MHNGFMSPFKKYYAQWGGVAFVRYQAAFSPKVIPCNLFAPNRMRVARAVLK